MDQLATIRSAAGPRISAGLEDAVIRTFLLKDARLFQAIDKAFKVWQTVDKDLYEMEEMACILHLQRKFQSLYVDATRQPYIPISGQGPWIVTLHGAIVHDSGGYGMLTFGHSPKHVLEALNGDYVMANVMTPSLEHKRFTDALEREIGHNRKNICPFESFVMLNSGSEGNAFVMRIIDVHTGHNRQSRHVKGLVVKGSFHGRTFQAALLTDTTESAYEDNKSHLLSTVIKDYKMTVDQNDLAGLRAAFDEAEKNNWFIETMYLEGVMGEGNPGSALTPEFYSLARELTLKHGSMLVVDSVQAGLRTTGNLSIVDYDGFEDMEAPDFEVWAKAINAGQYPCSLIALSPRAAKWYRHGVYGNTMTGNPRACAVATAVLNSITPSFRQSVVEKGHYVLSKYKDLQKDIPGAIDSVTGTGLLYAVKLNQAHLTVVASDGVEMGLRRAGVNVIHGGTNALRFTPNLDVTIEELDMQVAAVRRALLRAEQFIGLFQKVDTFNDRVKLMVNQQSEATAVCIFRLNGHLFDTGFINKLLDVAEQEKARVLVQNVQVGRSPEETSVATMQVFGDRTNQVGGLIQQFERLCGDGGVTLSVLSDPYEAAVSRL